MFGMLKKKFSDASAGVKKVENRDLMEAIVGGSLLMASADGEISQDELESLEAMIAANDSLSHFGNEIHIAMGKFEGLLKAGPRIGKMKILKEIKDIKNNPDHAEEVFLTVLTIAEADGEIDPTEQAILEEIAKTLGLNVKSYIE